MPNSILPFRFNLDYTGESERNRIIGEEHTLGAQKYRPIAPASGAFHVDNLEVFDSSTNEKLIRGRDYTTIGHIQVASAVANRDIDSVILITNPQVSNRIHLNISYVGGRYERSASSLVAVMNQINGDGKKVSFYDLLNRPTEFEPAPHYANLKGAVGYEYLIYELERLRQAVLVGDVVDHDHLAEYVKTCVELMKTTILSQNESLFQKALLRSSNSLTRSDNAMLQVVAQNNEINGLIESLRKKTSQIDTASASVALDEARARDLLLSYPSISNTASLQAFSSQPSTKPYTRIVLPQQSPAGVVASKRTFINPTGQTFANIETINDALLAFHTHLIKDEATGQAQIKITIVNLPHDGFRIENLVVRLLPVQIGVSLKPKEVTVFEASVTCVGSQSSDFLYGLSSITNNPNKPLAVIASQSPAIAREIATALLECRRDFNIAGATENPHRESVVLTAPTQGEIQLLFKLSGVDIGQVTGPIVVSAIVSADVRNTQTDSVESLPSGTVVSNCIVI